MKYRSFLNQSLNEQDLHKLIVRDKREFRIKIHGFTWSIWFLQADANEVLGFNGLCDMDSREIFLVKNNKSEENLVQTLIHELVHAITSPVVRSCNHLDEEINAELIGQQLMLVIPNLPKWVTRILNRFKEVGG